MSSRTMHALTCTNTQTWHAHQDIRLLWLCMMVTSHWLAMGSLLFFCSCMNENEYVCTIKMCDNMRVFVYKIHSAQKYIVFVCTFATQKKSRDFFNFYGRAMWCWCGFVCLIISSFARSLVMHAYPWACFMIINMLSISGGLMHQQEINSNV